MHVARYVNELAVAVQAVRTACRVAQQVQRQLDYGRLEKEDHSPVTVADFACQTVINSFLTASFPDDLIIGEEDSACLRSNKSLADSVVALANSVLELQRTEEQVLRLIDLGKTKASNGKRFWTLDPIDGTKGFIRRDQYALCLALVEGGEVQLGVLACPNLPFPTWTTNPTSCGTIMVAVKGEGAYQCALNDLDMSFTQLPGQDTHSLTNNVTPLSDLVLLESYESGHSNHDLSKEFANKLAITRDPLRLDSQCKYALLARRDGNVYLRIMRDPNFRESIWDHAAGALIAQEAGATITDVDGNALDYTYGRKLTNNVGILGTNVATGDNGNVHSQLLATLKSLKS